MARSASSQVDLTAAGCDIYGFVILNDPKKLGDFSRIVFEEVRRHAGVDAAHVYGGLLATPTAWAEHHSLPYEGIPIGTWKKALTGKGNASKTDVMAEIRSRGFAPATEDEADALGVLLCVREE